MATKNDPGKFDCYAAAEPDEPMFHLLARDPVGSYLVRAWAYLRTGDYVRTVQEICDAIKVMEKLPGKIKQRSDEKVLGAHHCALDMWDYYVRLVERNE